MEFKVGNVYAITLNIYFGTKPIYYRGKVIEDGEKEVKLLDSKEKLVTISKSSIAMFTEAKDTTTEEKMDNAIESKKQEDETMRDEKK